jgi:hypothetical protein
MRTFNYRTIEACRVGKQKDLVSVLNLGRQALTGVFPSSSDEPVTEGPLELVRSLSSGLLQLKHSYDPSEMYGNNYGYRSGLNQSMVDHLKRKVRFLEGFAALSPGDVVLDIGSNDCTLLKAYSLAGLTRIGIDPTGRKFRQHYPDGVIVVPDFYSADAFRRVCTKQAKVVTSVAMFYDLDDPIAFACQVGAVLAPDGVWHLEQSYMPSMMALNSYDTVCHEHIEYYSLNVLATILEAADLKIVDASTNTINGGSLAVTAVHKSDRSFEHGRDVVDRLLEEEDRLGLSTPGPYREFEERVFRHRRDLSDLVRTLVADGNTLLGYSASTKGNVVLQFCNFTSAEILAIADVNQEKFGRFTPRTHIPIIPESQARSMKPDYFLVLAWHFRDFIIAREREYLADGGKLIFPFPEIEIV